MRAAFPEFYDLIGVEYDDTPKAKSISGGKQKMRNCLKCKIKFKSAHYGNRTCGACAAQNQRASVTAGKVFL